MYIILDDEHFDIRQCLQIAKGLLKCVFGLHARGLVQSNLVLDDVLVRKTSVSILGHYKTFVFIF